MLAKCRIRTGIVRRYAAAKRRFTEWHTFGTNGWYLFGISSSFEAGFERCGILPEKFTLSKEFGTHFNSRKTVILDGTEQWMQCSVDYEPRKAFYIGTQLIDLHHYNKSTNISFKMENLSDKQNLFLDYLVKKLGFKQDSILAAYLENTADHANFINHIAHLDKYNKYNVIDFVLEDLNFKKLDSNFVPKKKNKELAAFTATDLAAFTFCAASYSISKTYETKETKLMSVGTQLHDKNFLIDFLSKKVTSGDTLVHNESFIDAQNSFFFDDLKKSKLIFSGHSESKREYFVNEFDSFAGQPDYVFQNNKSINFIIEEKYRPHNKSELNSYYDSHIIQLLSYLYKLVNFKAEYGYLVYWYYSEDLTIKKCKVLKVVKSLDNETKLNEVVALVQEFNNNSKIRFDTSKLNPYKCFRCSNKQYCGHKTGKFDSISLPYERRYSQLNYVEFPSELVKSKPQPTQIESNAKQHTISNNEMLNNLKW